MQVLKVCVTLCLLFILGSRSFAQDSTFEMKYGDVVEGSLPSDQGEAEYTFSGKSGDIIVIEVTNEDVLNGLQPQLKLLNERGTTITETSDIGNGLENFDVFGSILVLELPADGEYTILVTDGPYGVAQPNAKFVLSLLQPETLEKGDSVTGDVSNKVNDYFVVIADEEFSISYQKEGGTFSPSINVDRIENGALERLSTMYGSSLKSGIMGIEPNRNRLHLITVTASIYDLNLFQEVSAEYSLSLE